MSLKKGFAAALAGGVLLSGAALAEDGAAPQTLTAQEVQVARDFRAMIQCTGTLDAQDQQLYNQGTIAMQELQFRSMQNAADCRDRLGIDLGQMLTSFSEMNEKYGDALGTVIKNSRSMIVAP